MKKLFFTAVLLLFGINVANADVAANQELYAASNVISSFAHDNNFSIPADKVLNAKAVAILTDVKRSAANVLRGVLSSRIYQGFTRMYMKK